MPRKSPRRGRRAPAAAPEFPAIRPLVPRSAVSAITWPALPPPAAALLLALQYQLQQSETWPPEQLEAMQLECLHRLLGHAVATVPFYGERDAYGEAASATPLSAEAWSNLPVLTRADVQEAGAALASQGAPADHAPLFETVTSGTTGTPVHAVGTRVTAALWQAITLRDLAWHPRDISGKLAAIRFDSRIPPEGLDVAGWGDPVDVVYESGSCAVFNIREDLSVQADWLVRQQPDYLLSFPSNLQALAQYFQTNDVKLPALRGLTSYGEALSSDVRQECRAAWGAEVVDMYSTQEVGYVALQCPENETYHVQAEATYVEILDDDGRPCGPGEIGRVVVSTLHNFAMPLLRYDLGDYAEVGETCPCGRGLPVLSRIVGRERVATSPSGGGEPEDSARGSEETAGAG